MKTEEYETSEGAIGFTYKPEKGDVVTALYSQVGTNTKGKYENHFLKVKLSDDKEVTIKITDGQKKSLDKAGDLTGKTITFTEYENDFGTFVGCNVAK